ncbi:MAG: lysylphosphatidylglycerol synthase transmembrane domain-containing protein [Chloroflexota bacterium]
MPEPGPDAAPHLPGPELEVPPEDTVSLGKRLRQPTTILSIVVPLILVVLVFRLALKIDVQELINGVQQANKPLLLLAFIVFYIGFPLRGYRWGRILSATRFRLNTKDGTEVLFLSWLVNCLVPAKLGDVYRAYLLKLNEQRASLSRTFGTVFIERLLDIFAIAILGLGAGFWSFRNGFPPEIQFVVALGIGVIIFLAVLLLTLRNFGRGLLVRLHVPNRFVELYDKFEEGVFGAVGPRHLPPLIVLTGMIWATEGLRLFFVVQALGFPDVELGISGAFFVALIGSLLTAVPLSPAGLGTVELGVTAVLTLAYGIPNQEAATIVIVDRLISVFSIIVLGGILYVVSGKRRGAGLAPGSGPIEGLEAPSPA